MSNGNSVILRKRPGASGRKQQVWIAWKFSNARERAFAIEELQRLGFETGVGTAMARPTDHPTSKMAAATISKTAMTELEQRVFQVVLRTERKGIIWDEAEQVTRLRPGSISPRWKSLRKQKRILAALED